jgi:hypothetical protein
MRNEPCWQLAFGDEGNAKFEEWLKKAAVAGERGNLPNQNGNGIYKEVVTIIKITTHNFEKSGGTKLGFFKVWVGVHLICH